jgi:opacity protein-like surface antigen
MKKIVSAILLLLLSSTSFAQGKGDVEFGFNIGYNGASVSTPDGNTDRIGGINAAAAADYYFSKSWSVKGKLIYDQKGWGKGFIENLNTGEIFKTDYRLNYLTIPVTANWHFGNTKNWYLNFGPYLGFLMNAKETRFGTDVKEAFNTSDFGLALAIGVKIPVSNKLKLSIEYDTQSGLANIFKQSDGENVLNSRYSLNVGVNFLMK